jgi:hypothetical protein
MEPKRNMEDFLREMFNKHNPNFIIKQSSRDIYSYELPGTCMCGNILDFNPRLIISSPVFEVSPEICIKNFTPRNIDKFNELEKYIMWINSIADIYINWSSLINPTNRVDKIKLTGLIDIILREKDDYGLEILEYPIKRNYAGSRNLKYKLDGHIFNLVQTADYGMELHFNGYHLRDLNCSRDDAYNMLFPQHIQRAKKLKELTIEND